MKLSKKLPIYIFTPALTGFLWVASYGYAQSDTFDGYVKKLQNHPQVEEILSSKNKFSELSKGAMGLPSPQIILGVDNVPVDDHKFNRFLPTAKVFGFKQEIPSYRLRRANSEQQSGMSDKQKLIADYTLKRLEAYLVTALSELDKVKQLENYAEKQLKHYVELEAYLKGQLEAGNSVYGKFSEVDVEHTEVEQKLNNLKAERIEIEAELIRLIGEVPVATLPDVPMLDWNRYNLDRVYAVRITQSDVLISEKGVDFAKASFRPNYGVQALYKKREEGQNFSGEDWFSVQATVSIPLWYSWNQKPKLKAAKAERQAKEFAYDDMKRYWDKKLVSLAAQRDMTLKNISLLQEKKKSIRGIVAAAERNYEAGNVNLESVLNAQIDELTIASQLATQRSLHIRLSAEFNSHLIEKSNSAKAEKPDETVINSVKHVDI